MTENHLERLLRTLTSEDGMARKRAREIITLIGDDAVPQLWPLLQAPDKRTRWEAAKALGSMVHPGSTETLVRLLDDPTPEVRWLAGTGLLNLGPRSLVPVLRPLTQPPLSRGRAEMSGRVLRGLSGDNDTLAGIVTQLLTALERKDAALVVPAAALALAELDHISGRSLETLGLPPSWPPP